MQSHRITPESALLAKEWHEINRHAWRLRRMTGGQLKLAMLLSVPEGLRKDVEKRVHYLQLKHQKKD